jgi:NAD(P)-dependent dehydrogenase (short-subunit alcohol dehydrogenase family)
VLADAGRPRAALLAGATGGIGAALAEVLVREGCLVTLSGRRADELGRRARQLDPHGHGTQCVTADLTQPDAGASLVGQHLSRFAALDVLVFAAGAGRPLALGSARPDVWRRLIDVNLVAAAELVAAALPALRQSGAGPYGATVILVSSIAARRPVAGFAAYSASKAGLSSLAASINEEEASSGVRATALCPGYVDTPLTKPIDRCGGDFLQPSDVAEALRFLIRLSPRARVPYLEITRIGAADGSP